MTMARHTYVDEGGFCRTCGLPESNMRHGRTVTDTATRGFRHGSTYDVRRDYERLNAQARRVWEAMADHGWHTLAELAAATGDPEASVSARLRDFRKPEFGGHEVERRRRTPALWEYRMATAEVPA